MKRIISSLLILSLLSSLIACGNTTTPPTTSEPSSAASEPQTSESISTVDPPLSESDEEIFTILSELVERGTSIMYWYYGEVHPDYAPELEIKLNHSDFTDDGYAADPYRRVGRFGTIAEMQAATEEVFTQTFAKTVFYDKRDTFTDPSGGDKPMYKEIDGVLHRDITSGGFGWYWGLGDVYDVAFLTDDLAVLTVKCNVMDNERWYDFVMKKENGNWKLEKLYDYSPYMSYAEAIRPAVDSWLCSYDWTDINELSANALLVFYATQYLSELGVEDYNVEDGYAVPANEVMQNMARSFVGMQKETLVTINDADYASAYYDETADSFVFYLTRDGAGFVIIAVDENAADVAITVLVIGKSGKAVGWGELGIETAQDTYLGFRYISNRHTEIE